jgi:hypothetical protein
VTQRRDAIERTRHEITREAERERRHRIAADRGAARDAERDDEDRDVRRERLRKAMTTDDPISRLIVEAATDRAEIDRLRDRAATDSTPERETTREITPDLDAGRGTAPEQPWRPSWGEPGLGF